MHKRQVLESLAIVVVLGLFLWGLISAFLFPIYSDEVTYRLFLERLFINGGYKQSVTPYCSEGFLASPPVMLLPAAAAWSALSVFKGGYWSYRIVPCLCWLGILAVLYGHGRRHADQSFWPLVLLLLVGPSIYGLVLFRPEIVLLMLGVLIYFWGSALTPQIEVKSVVVGALLLIFAYSMVLYMHPKAVYLAPTLALALIARASGLPSRGWRYAWLGVGFALVGGTVLSAVGLHNLQYMSCAAYPSVAKTMGSQAVNPLHIASDPEVFLAKMEEAFSTDLWTMVGQRVSYWYEYEVAFLPGTVGDQDFLLAVRYVVIALLLLVTLTFVVKLSVTIIVTKQRSGFYAATLLLLLAMGLIGPFVLNLKRHFYDVSLLVGSVVVLGCLAWPLRATTGEAGHASGAPLVKWATSSAFLLLGLFGTWMNMDFVEQFQGGYEGPSISLQKVRAQEDAAVSVRKSLARLGVAEQAPLLIDELTYDLVWEHRRLYPITYLSVNLDVARDVAVNVKSYNIRYGVTRCVLLTPFRSLLPVTILETLQHPPLDDLCIFEV